MSRHDHVAVFMCPTNLAQEFQVLHTPCRVEMRVRLIQQEKRFVFPCKAKQTEDHQELLFALTEFAKGQRTINLSRTNANPHFADELRDVRALQRFEEILLRAI